MLIVGAKGFAKEVLEVCLQNNELDNLVFYDDVNTNISGELYGKFPVLKSLSEAKHYFSTIDNRYTIGIGNPALRFLMFSKFTELGGVLTSTISCNTDVGHYQISIGEGCNILSGVRISNDVSIGEGTLIYYNTIITHDVRIGKFCEISPDVKLLGRCVINDFVKIGTGAIIFPDIEIGNKSVIGAGSVVRRNVPENVIVAGIPAVIKKTLNSDI